MAASPKRLLHALWAIAACGVGLSLAGCDVDDADPPARPAKLWDTGFADPPATLPEMVQSVIASGDEGFAPIPSLTGKPGNDDADLAMAMRPPLVEDAPMPAITPPAESLHPPADDASAPGTTEEEPRYAWLLDSTSPADD